MVNVKQKLAEHITVGSYKEEAMNSIIRPNLLNECLLSFRRIRTATAPFTR